MVGIHTKGPVSWTVAGVCQPLEPAQTHLPHEHEEEAGSGHESSPAGGRQHPKHGHNYGGSREKVSVADCQALTPHSSSQDG